MRAKQPVFQRHHIVYKDANKWERTRKIRKGVHQALTLLTRHQFLTDEEINAIMIECELRRIFCG